MPVKFRTGDERRWAVCDKANPDALIYQVWPEFAEKILELDARLPDIWSFTEAKIERWVKPTQMLRQLRAIFWSHVYRNRQLSLPIKEKHILVGFLERSTFFDIIKIDANLAFLLRPPSRIESLFESLLHQGLRVMGDVIQENVWQKKGVAKRNHIANVLMIIRELERKLCRDQSAVFHARVAKRKKIYKEITAEGILINAEPPSPLPPTENFDYNEFEELMEEDDVEGLDGSDSGNDSIDESKEGSSRGEEKI